MRPRYLNWLVIGVGLMAACAIAGQLATAQPKWNDPGKVSKQADSEDPFVKSGKTIQNRSKSFVEPYREAPSNGESAGDSKPAFREVVEEYVDQQGRKNVIHRMVPVLPDPLAERKSHLNQSLRECVEDYQGAPNEAKTAMEAKFETQLGELFDLQQQEREAQLKPMEERVKKLREMLSKRAAMRDDLIQLRLKVLLQDADGMGWGPDEFLMPLRNSAGQPGSNAKYEPSGEFQPARTPLSPNKTEMPSFRDDSPSRNDDSFQDPAKNPDGGVPNPEDAESKTSG